MKKATVIASIMIMLLLAHWTQAGVSLIRNGSFENDGQILDITAEAPRYWPRYWCDVNVPSGKFGGWVSTDWKTHGDYSLSLYSDFSVEVEFTAGDIATVSQQVYLTDVNQIIFDLRLGTIAGFAWDPSKRSALMLIDGDVVWDSSDWMPDASGEYRNQMVDVNEMYKNESLHTLSLAMRANVSEMEWFYQYLAQWDFVKFDAYCGGFGYLREDIDRDCYVGFRDFAMLAGHWLEENPAYKYDLVEDGIVDEYDLMFFAEGWLDCSYWDDADCLEVELLAGDIDDSGEVDLGDVLILANSWLAAADCKTRADINDDDVVDFRDFAVMADQWRLKSWLYGLE